MFICEFEPVTQTLLLPLNMPQFLTSWINTRNPPTNFFLQFKVLGNKKLWTLSQQWTLKISNGYN